MGGKIDCYIDIASYYSHVAFADLLSKREALLAHGVTVEFHPVLIAGVMAGSGNQPPWKLPLKGKYYQLDLRRTAARVGLAHHGDSSSSPFSGTRDVSAVTLAFPPDFLSMSRTVLPLRALLFAKGRWGEGAFEALAADLFARFFTPPHQNVSLDSVLEAVLREVSLPLGGGDGDDDDNNSKTTNEKEKENGRRKLTAEEIQEIMQATASEALKAKLREDTDMVVKQMGAFGLPWWWVTRYESEGGDKSDGVEEPFWGSDRFYEVCVFLGVPCRDVEVGGGSGGGGGGGKSRL